ncbi:MAG: ABC transporter permease [Lachnospiraceae bacterium]|nr:ABC transporter permease [Lachnospiraceae bacterium]
MGKTISKRIKSENFKNAIIYHFKDKAIWIVFIILFIAFSIANQRFMTVGNQLLILRQVSMFGIAAIGMTFVILTAGIDLSVGSIISIVGVICASLMVYSNTNMWLAILVALFAATIIGLINGVMVASVGIPPIIATFASQIVVQGIALIIADGTPVFGFTDDFRIIGQGMLFESFYHIPSVPIPILIMIFCFAAGSFILNKTYFGRYFYAIGGNEEASRLSGIRIKRIKYAVYALSGFFSGLAGIVLLSRTHSAQPTSGMGWEFDVITCVVLGGVSINGGSGKFSNVIAGVLIIGILTNGMVLMDISMFTQMIVRGCVLALAVGFDCIQKKRQVV